MSNRRNFINSLLSLLLGWFFTRGATSAISEYSAGHSFNLISASHQRADAPFRCKFDPQDSRSLAQWRAIAVAKEGGPPDSLFILEEGIMSCM
jgi:hypothetical protein